jgi:hypothetical protein
MFLLIHHFYLFVAVSLSSWLASWLKLAAGRLVSYPAFIRAGGQIQLRWGAETAPKDMEYPEKLHCFA